MYSCQTRESVIIDGSSDRLTLRTLRPTATPHFATHCPPRFRDSGAMFCYPANHRASVNAESSLSLDCSSPRIAAYGSPVNPSASANAGSVFNPDRFNSVTIDFRSGDIASNRCSTRKCRTPHCCFVRTGWQKIPNSHSNALN